eukprot:3778583-Amphidinium_carterae.1
MGLLRGILYLHGSSIFIRLLDSHMRVKEIVVAFADDVTLILSALDRLHGALLWFDVLREAMSLLMKISKTRINCASC